MIGLVGRERVFGVSLLVLVMALGATVIAPRPADAEIEAKGKALDAALSQLHGNLEEIIERVRSSEKQLAAALERQDVLLEKLDASTEEADALRRALDEARAAHAAETRARAQLEATLEEAHRQLADAQQRLTTTSAHYDKLSQRFTETKRLLSAELGFAPDEPHEADFAVASEQGRNPGQSADAPERAVLPNASSGRAENDVQGEERPVAGSAGPYGSQPVRGEDASRQHAQNEPAEPQSLAPQSKQSGSNGAVFADVASMDGERVFEDRSTVDDERRQAGLLALEDMSTGAVGARSTDPSDQALAGRSEEGPQATLRANLSTPGDVEPGPATPATMALMEGEALLPGSLDQALIERFAIRVEDQAIRFRLAGEGLFGFDSDAIAKRGRQDLDDVASLIRDLGTERLVITGHTDSTGDPDYNLWLSRQRARAVGDALAARGVMADFVIEGAGAGEPIADNRTREGRSTNRRVEFTVPLAIEAASAATR